MAERTGWTEHALRVLGSRGFRAGGARSAVVDFLGRAGGCLTADEVVAGVRGEGGRAGPASVYRALNLLSELDLLHRAGVGEGPPRYELVHPDDEHHHHIVCERCGRTVAFQDRDLEAAIEGLSERVGYVVASHDVTLRGACASCAASALQAARASA
jgi:Fur family ferric uptake transcriptional regulator